MRDFGQTKVSCFFISIIFLTTFSWGTPTVFAQRSDANVLAAKAALAYDKQQYDEALALVDQALKLDPQHERSLFYKGLVSLAQKEPEKAIGPLEAVHELRPADLDIQHHLGVAYFAAGEYDKSQPFMEAVFENDPDTENMGYYVGFLRYRGKQYGNSVEAFDQNQTPSADIQQLNGFYRGLALGVLGLPSEALSELEQVQRTQAVAPLTQASVRIRDALSAGQIFGSKKRFRLQISLGGFYDDNVKINPDSAGPVPNNNANLLLQTLRARDTTAPGFLASLRADYSFLQKGPFEATATYSFFQTLHGEGFDEFNIQNHSIGVSGFYRGVVKDFPFQLGAQYTYDYLFLDSDGFLSRHTPTLSATVLGPTFTLPGVGVVGNLTTGLYRYQYKTFFREIGNRDARFRGDLRDGYNNTFGLIHAFRLKNDRLILRMGYQYDNESTEGTTFSYEGDRVLTGGQLQLPWGKMTLRYDYDIHWRNYKNNQTTAGFTNQNGQLATRKDRQQTHLVQLTKPLPHNLSLTAQYQGIRNKSNINLYDYSKNAWTMILTWTY